MTENIFLGCLGAIGVGAVVRIFWLYAKHAGWNRGFEDGCAFVRRVVESEQRLRNVEPVALSLAEQRLLREVLRDLDLEDHGTIH